MVEEEDDTVEEDDDTRIARSFRTNFPPEQIEECTLYVSGKKKKVIKKGAG